MTISLKDRARVKELAAEIRQIMGGDRNPDGSPKTFDQIESEAIELSDLLAAEVIAETVDVQAGAVRGMSMSKLPFSRQVD